IRLGERLVADRFLRHHALDEAGAVAQRKEVNLAARAPVVQPAAEAHGLPFVFGNVLDVHSVSHVQYARSFSNRCLAACAFFSTSAGVLVLASSIRYVPS